MKIYANFINFNSGANRFLYRLILLNQWMSQTGQNYSFCQKQLD